MAETLKVVPSGRKLGHWRDDLEKEIGPLILPFTCSVLNANSLGTFSHCFFIQVQKEAQNISLGNMAAEVTHTEYCGVFPFSFRTRH